MKIIVLLVASTSLSSACELCAIYNAGSVAGQVDRGFGLTVSEQYVPNNVTLFDSREVSLKNPSYVNSFVTHVVPSYNFSSRFGVSLNCRSRTWIFDGLISDTAPPRRQRFLPKKAARPAWATFH